MISLKGQGGLDLHREHVPSDVGGPLQVQVEVDPEVHRADEPMVGQRGQASGPDYSVKRKTFILWEKFEKGTK